MKATLSGALVVLLSSYPCSAGTFVVDLAGGGDFTDIQAALVGADRETLRAAAAVAVAEDWPDRAIAALGDSGDRRWYAWRFPSPHIELVRENAAANGLDPAWVMGLMRSESALAEDAISHAGARGLMQIMPATFDEISKKNPQFSKLESPKWNIAAGIYYNRTLYRKFTKTAEQDKLYMTFASYNAGYGRILNASKRTPSEEKVWDEIKDHLPRETQGYVKRIRRLMGEI